MGNLLEAIHRAWAHRKLRKGQCAQCRTALPDDAVTRFCDTECADAFEYDRTPII